MFVSTTGLHAQAPVPRGQGPALPPQNQERTPAAPRVGGTPVAVAPAPQAPTWFPQPVEHQKYVDDVLKFWEQSSSKIERYRCQFTRWEYDPAFVKPDPKTNKSPAIKVSYGEIKYAQPDKGLFKVTKMLHYNAPKTPEDKAQYLPQEGEIGEHWVCDGKSIFEFDHPNKKLIDHQLPPDMHGKAIVDGPLPFLFGANAAKIQERYWVGVFTPKTAKGEYWLEAWPKRAEDARNYKKVEIIIDEKDFLPKAIQIYNHGGVPGNPSSSVLTFEKREVNFSVSPLGKLDPLELANWVTREFHEPATPFGWKKEVERFNAVDGQQGPANADLRKQTNQAMRSVPLPQIPLRRQ
ncbi:MAG TPA: TIGR03009 domain-containing protein [Pirellulaceae bacterium]|nr:TIGR03009 domain-containing protein [Pirellulaceae bacterium]